MKRRFFNNSRQSITISPKTSARRRTALNLRANALKSRVLSVKAQLTLSCIDGAMILIQIRMR